MRKSGRLEKPWKVLHSLCLIVFLPQVDEIALINKKGGYEIGG